jgi:hypothetical protein
MDTNTLAITIVVVASLICVAALWGAGRRR